MTPFPLGLDSPGKRLSSTRDNRSAARLNAIIAEHHFRGHARYTPRDVDGRPGDETWCNLFAQDVCEAMGVMVPRQMRANQLVQWLAQDAAPFDWECLSLATESDRDAAHVAQAMADEGQLALVGWVNPAGPGHIAVVVPSLGEPGLWIAQAGRINFTRAPLAQGFGGRVVTFFGHP